ncbi:G-PROTEIN-RECEP-F1-2 domain-containing protein [Aphelenchoides fujianensis]|nr:G-PROTEIN-RECEP-F1-2 domain-containing protein [Aphelenchoides fujianensis]
MNNSTDGMLGTADWNETKSTAAMECGMYEIYTLARFLFLSGASLIAILGMVANAFLVHLFITHKPTANTPPTLYPGVLAALDCVLCAMYVAIMGADAAVFYLSSAYLFELFHLYIVQAFFLSKVTQLAIPYMLIFATLERLVWISGGVKNRLLKKMYSVRGRYVTIILSLGSCVCLRLPVLFAYEVQQFPDCPNFFRSKMANVAEWVGESQVYHFYDFHGLVIAQTFIPFGVLIVLNFMVVRRLARVQSSNDLETQRPSTCSTQMQEAMPPLLSPHDVQREFSFDRKPSAANGGEKRFSMSIGHYDLHSLMPRMSRRTNSAVRAAIYTMVGIVSSYLVSNSLHLVLTILERSKVKILEDPEDPNLASGFHTAFSDLVSFIYMFTSAIRILIYMGCNPQIRAEILQRLRNLSPACKRASLKQQQANGTAL